MSLKSNLFNANYELPSIESQTYLFKNKYFSQELLSFEENKPRKVSKNLLYLINIFINQ